MAIQISIQGLERVNHFLVKLPKNVTNEIEMAGDEFSKFVQKSAKLRAPKDTHELANSITVTHPKKNRIEVTVNSPYGIFQETGFRPHWIHTNQIIGSNKLEQIYGTTPRFIFVSKFTPFIQPALAQGLINLPNLIQTHLNKAIKESGG